MILSNECYWKLWYRSNRVCLCKFVAVSRPPSSYAAMLRVWVCLCMFNVHEMKWNESTFSGKPVIFLHPCNFVCFALALSNSLYFSCSLSLSPNFFMFLSINLLFIQPLSFSHLHIKKNVSIFKFQIDSPLFESLLRFCCCAPISHIKWVWYVCMCLGVCAVFETFPSENKWNWFTAIRVPLPFSIWLNIYHGGQKNAHTHFLSKYENLLENGYLWPMARPQLEHPHTCTELTFTHVFNFFAQTHIYQKPQIWSSPLRGRSKRSESALLLVRNSYFLCSIELVMRKITTNRQ